VITDKAVSLLKPKKLKKLDPVNRSQTVALNKPRPKALGDGRKIGFNNPTIMPILARERNTKLDGEARARREASIDGYRDKLMQSMQYTHHISMNHAEKSIMNHNISQLCSKSPDCSMNLDLPIEMKIHKL